MMALAKLQKSAYCTVEEWQSEVYTALEAEIFFAAVGSRVKLAGHLTARQTRCARNGGGVKRNDSTNC